MAKSLAPRLAAALSLLLPVLWVAGSRAQTGQDQRVRELTQIRSEIERLEARLEQLKRRESGLEGRLKQIRLELDLQQSRVREAVTATELAAARTAAVEAKVEGLERALQQIRGDLKRRVVGIYRLSRDGYLRLFLSLRPDDRMLPAIRQLRFLARRDQQVLERYAATRDELTAERARLAAERLERERWQRRQEEQRDLLATLRRRHEQVLADLARERRQLTERAEALQEKERKLTRLIASLLGNDSVPLSGTPMQEFRGVIDWPLEGEVTAGFGPRLDPRYRTEVPHNGLDVEAERGTEVRAVFPGQVLYASQFEGYGTMVVLYHPGQVFTLYAGLGEVRVAKDDMLSLGDVLGTVAGTFYFEIRVENQPEDPLRWLR